MSKRKIKNFRSEVTLSFDRSAKLIGNYLLNYKDYLFLILVSVLIFTIYLPTLKGGFFYDDNHTVLTQHLIRDVGFSDLISQILTMTPRSLLTFTYYLNFKISYIEPFSYHLFNILIHIFTTIAVFFLSIKLINIFSSIFSNKTLNRYFPYLTTILFAVHPMMSEATAYVSSRSDQLPTFFTFLSLISFINFLEKKNYIYLVSSFISVYLGILGKDTGVMIPFILLAFLFFYLRNKKEAILKNSNYFLLIPHFVILIIYLLIQYGTLNVLQRASEIGELVNTTPLYQYFISELYGNLFYLRLLLFPVGLSIRHDLVLVSGFTDPKFLISVAIFISIFYLLWKFFRNNNLVLFGVTFYIFAIAPVASIVRLVEVIAEHRVYHPSFGLYIVFVIIFLKIFDREFTDFRKYILNGGIVLITIILSILTFQRSLVWIGEIPLWTDALANRDPDATSTVIYNNVGLAYFRDGQYGPAVKYYTEGAVNSNLTSYHNLANLGTLYREKKEYERAIKFFDLSITAKPDFAYAYFDQGVSYAQLATVTKDVELADEYMLTAKEKFLKTLEIDPYYLGAHRNIGLIEQRYGNTDKALEYFQKGVQLEPYEGKYYHDIALIYMEKRDLVKATEYLQQAIHFMPEQGAPYLNLGLVLLDQKKPEEAIPVFQNAYTNDNSLKDVFYFLGISYEYLGQFNEAKTSYEKAISLNASKNKEALGALQRLKNENKI